LVVASAIANIAVLAYHHLVPAHPKFLIVGFRRWVLRVHVLSGTLEFAAGLVALATIPNATAATVMATAALLGHVPTACIQTAIVFGSRAVMRPAYAACIAVHAFAAVMLLRFPESQFWLVSTFLVFNIYVWCRVYYFLFDKFGFFGSSKYTVAIVLAGLTTSPAVLGPGAPLALLGCVGLHLLLHAVLVPFGPGELADFVRERPRDSMHSDALGRSIREGTIAPARSDRDKARVVFDLFDRDADGTIAVAELRLVLDEWSLPRDEVDRWLREIDVDRNGHIGFDEFLLRMRPVWRFVHHDAIEVSHGPRPDMISRALAAHRAEAAIREREALCARIDFLASAGAEFVTELAACMIPRQLRADESLPDGADAFWIVRTGRVRIEHDGQHVAELGEGQWFGDGVLRDTPPRPITVVAIASSELFELSPSSFRELLDRHPHVARRIAEITRA
jgi:hypothetical protein